MNKDNLDQRLNEDEIKTRRLTIEDLKEMGLNIAKETTPSESVYFGRVEEKEQYDFDLNPKKDYGGRKWK